MELVLLAVLIGLIPGAIAANKGHSFVAWWFFGCLLFIIALPLAIIIKPTEEKLLEQSTTVPPGHRKCPECAEFVKEEARVCRFCKTELSSSQEETPERRTRELA